MKNLTQYIDKVSKLFHSFVNGTITKKELIRELYKIEAYHWLHSDVTNDLEEGDLWFKFSKDDTLATTIANLDFELDSLKRNTFYKEQMQQAISLDGELQIYYS